MSQTCRQCSKKFTVSVQEQTLLQKVAPIINGQRYDVPLPTFCFTCNLQRRLSWYNCRRLYKRTCSATSKPIISIYSPQKPFTVYDSSYWHSDQWNPLQYGREYEFSRTFSEQFRDLMESVPHINLAILGDNVNSDFTNDNYKTKNCYLLFDGEQAQDCYYGHTFVGLKNCIDFLSLSYCELCYECTHCLNCYHLLFSRYCQNCSNSWFLRDCIGCKHCFGCANLHQKEYCILNEYVGKEHYDQFIASFDSGSYAALQAMRKRCEDFFAQQPVRATRTTQNIESSGDNLHQSKNAQECFDCNQLQDCYQTSNCLMNGKDLYRVHAWGDNTELGYNTVLMGAQSRGVIGGLYIFIGCENVYYSQWCSRSTKDCFGCIGLTHKQYCILNKQYSKQEYEELVPQIIKHMRSTGEWGEYLDPSFSAFGYNETMAQTYFPLTEQKVSEYDWQWCNEEPALQADRTITANHLPDRIDEIPNDVLNWAIQCIQTHRPFKLTKQELDYYRRVNLPAPRLHPDIRHQERITYKPGFTLHTRICNSCNKQIKTAYKEHDVATVLCEECYRKEVY